MPSVLLCLTRSENPQAVLQKWPQAVDTYRANFREWHELGVREKWGGSQQTQRRGQVVLRGEARAGKSLFCSVGWLWQLLLVVLMLSVVVVVLVKPFWLLS